MTTSDLHPIDRARPGSAARRATVALLAAAVVLACHPGAGVAAAADRAAPPKGATAGGAQRATFGIGPANATAVDGRAGFNYVVTRGASLSDDVAIVNLADRPVTLKVYATDAAPQTDGTTGLLPADTLPTDAGSWIRLRLDNPTGTVSLGARATVIVPLSIAVPADAPPGDHAAGIVASLVSDAKTDRGDIVHLDQRVAVRASLRVSGHLKSQLSVEHLHAVYHQSLLPWAAAKVTVSYTVRNTGNVRLGAQQQLSVDGFLGVSRHGPKLPAIPVLLPGASVEVHSSVARVPPALWASARVQLDPSSPSSDVDPGLHVFAHSKRVFTLPWSLLVTLAVLLAGAWRVRRRRLAQAGSPS